METFRHFCLAFQLLLSVFFFFFPLPDLSPTGKRHSREGNRGRQNGGTNIEVGCKKINGKGKIQARGNPERLCFSFRV